ncbi:glycosyltransferase family 4 protein [Aliterella atlantica]|uniref:glycosyltransferase family 4 protein n=1 Tax=Aliterella atlantica TaxID=1827278 RepID=UPI0009E3E39B|nr:glycosyltransferase family 4 protein [Aliterella atlantica]
MNEDYPLTFNPSALPYIGTHSKVTTPDILIVSRVFPPEPGGIQDYVYNRCLQDPQRAIALTASAPDTKNFDADQPFPIYRWFAPKFLHDFFARTGLWGGIIKQILYLIESWAIAIGLFFRYRYRYIEWFHGYDFPALLLLSYLLPIRYFIYLHGDDLLCSDRHPIIRALFTRTLQRAEGVICNSDFTCNYLKTRFQFTTPTYTINPTIRVEKFGGQTILDSAANLRAEVRKAHNIPDDAVVILSVGRLVRRKGFDRVIATLPQLLAQNLDVYYLICGRGAMESELKALVQQLGVEQRTIFAGYVPDDRLSSYYAACDLLAMPTFYDAEVKSIEGFGIVYLEAGFFGKPVIASRLGGVEDAVCHGENGLLVDPNSPTEFADSLLLLCQDKQLRTKLGRKGQEIASKQTPHRIIYQPLPL